MKHKNSTAISRRQFLKAAGVAGGALLLGPAWLRAADEEVDPRVAKLVTGTLGIDTHNHVDVPLIAADVPGPDLDLAGELRCSGFSAICATFAVDYQRLGVPGLAYERFQNALSSMDAQLARNHMQRALNLKDLQAAHDQAQPTIVQAVRELISWKASWSASRRLTSGDCGSWTCFTTATPRRRWATSTRRRRIWAG